MGTCGGADPAGVTIRLAVNLGRLSLPGGYDVHRYSGIALATTAGSVSGNVRLPPPLLVLRKLVHLHTPGVVHLLLRAVHLLLVLE